MNIHFGNLFVRSVLGKHFVFVVLLKSFYVGWTPVAAGVHKSFCVVKVDHRFVVVADVLFVAAVVATVVATVVAVVVFEKTLLFVHCYLLLK